MRNHVHSHRSPIVTDFQTQLPSQGKVQEESNM